MRSGIEIEIKGQLYRNFEKIRKNQEQNQGIPKKHSSAVWIDHRKIIKSEKKV